MVWAPRKETLMKRAVICRSIGVAAALVLVLSLASAATRASTNAIQTPRGDPAVFLTRIVTFIVQDDYTHAWTTLYPAHKRVASRQEYVGCELKQPVGMTLESIDVLGVRDRVVRIPGQSTAVVAKSVTLRITVTDPVSGAPAAFTHAFRAVPAGSRWAWILTPQKYALYRDNAC
jgi:hypothetical protein